MRRKKIYPYFLLLITLFCLLSLPEMFCQKMRFFAISSIAPSWQSCLFCQKKISLLFATSVTFAGFSEKAQEKYDELHRENKLLSAQIGNLRQWLLSEDRIDEQIMRIKAIDSLEVEEKWRGYFHRRREQLATLLKLQLKALPAKVIYREPSSWSSFIWLNVGEKQNKAMQERIIAKNSPVVIGNALVGVVEEVGDFRCKVRLITDANLFPAVRSVRGGLQDQVLAQRLEGLFQVLQARDDLFESFEEKDSLLAYMQSISSRLNGSSLSLYLAKGELHGSSRPLWRSRGQFLKGIGFNYDFADEEGPARDLQVVNSQSKSLSLLKEGDLLITSGLDGVFPVGLEVAVVSKIFLLKEGASSYEIEAKAVAENFDELIEVFVLPPLHQ